MVSRPSASPGAVVMRASSDAAPASLKVTGWALRGLRGRPPCCLAISSLTSSPSGGQAVDDVGGRIAFVERLELLGQDDALAERREPGLADALAQLRLADEDDLDELLRVGIEVAQQAQLLESGVGERLGLVDVE